jgi:hypothetical protein
MEGNMSMVIVFEPERRRIVRRSGEDRRASAEAVAVERRSGVERRTEERRQPASDDCGGWPEYAVDPRSSSA